MHSIKSNIFQILAHHRVRIISVAFYFIIDTHIRIIYLISATLHGCCIICSSAGVKFRYVIQSLVGCQFHENKLLMAKWDGNRHKYVLIYVVKQIEVDAKSENVHGSQNKINWEQNNKKIANTHFYFIFSSLLILIIFSYYLWPYNIHYIHRHYPGYTSNTCCMYHITRLGLIVTVQG